ncbi:MAG: dienelactone hydrolase family protein [Burkholderiaceae bacterium]
MGERITITSSDGASIPAWLARPAGSPKGCVVVVQEIFGVNDHVRWVCEEQYARAGYVAVAPCVFDRLEAGVELAYNPESVARGRELVDRLGVDAPLRDIRAAADRFGAGLKTGVVGYCWGGTIAFLASTRLGLPAVGYYGGRTVPYLHERPQAPLMLHFGELDAIITADVVAKTRAALPQATVHTYPAGHGFNRFGHPDWHDESARLAYSRTLEFFERHLR